MGDVASDCYNILGPATIAAWGGGSNTNHHQPINRALLALILCNHL